MFLTILTFRCVSTDVIGRAIVYAGGVHYIEAPS
jgi:hypothetical protein